MSTTTLSIAFAIERRSDGYYFRRSDNPDAVWHGPSPGPDDVASTIEHYVLEEIIETLEQDL